MHSISRHTLVSVVATVLMVVMTVLFAAWSPPQPQLTSSVGVASSSVAPHN